MKKRKVKNYKTVEDLVSNLTTNQQKLLLYMCDNVFYAGKGVNAKD